MNMSTVMNYAAALLTIIAALVALTNIIVEVIKKMTWNKIPADLLAVIVAMLLTLLAFFAWAAYVGFAVLWYYIVAAVVVGFMVAYAAMYGFDKLKDILVKFKDNVA